MNTIQTKFWQKKLSNISSKAKIGNFCTIHSHVWIGDKVKIGDYVQIEAFAFIPPNVTIEDHCFIGPHVCFTNDKHPPSDDWRKTLVMEGASIGANATILPGITIGKKSIIGAGAVVTKSVPDGETWIGNPASKKYENSGYGWNRICGDENSTATNRTGISSFEF